MADGFDWSKYQTVEEAPSEDSWSKYQEVSSEEEPIATPTLSPDMQYTTTEAFGQGALDIGSLGFSDEVIGAVKALKDKLAASGEDVSFADAYKTYRDLERTKQEAAREQHPYAYGAGGVAGGLTTAALTGGFGLAGEGAGAAGVIGSAALEGGALGIGASKAEIAGAKSPEELKQALIETGEEGLSSAAIGAGTAGLFTGAGKLIGKTELGRAIGESFKQGLKGKATFGKEAKEALSGEIKSAAKEMASEVEAIRKEVGKQIGELWSNPSFHKEGIEAINVANPIIDFTNKLSKSTIPEGLKSTIRSNIFGEDILKLPKKEMEARIKDIVSNGINKTPQEFRQLINQIEEYGFTNYGPEASQLGALARDARDELVKTAKENLLNKEAVETLNSLNPRYAAAKKAQMYMGLDTPKGRALENKRPTALINKFVKSGAPESSERAVQVEAEQFLESLKKIHPKLGNMAGKLKDFQTRENLLGGAGSSFNIGPISGMINKYSSETANVTGRAINALTPEALTNLGNKLAQSSPALAQKVNKVVSAESKPARAAAIFALHQIPQFRNLAKTYVVGEEE